MNISKTIPALGMILALASGLASAQTTYRLTDLGSLGSGFSYGVAINEAGQAVGMSYTADFAYRAFFWDGAVMHNIGTLGGTYVAPMLAINDAGQVTGQSTTSMARFPEHHAFLWDGTAMRDLGTLGGPHSIGNAINVSGQVTGYAFTPPNPAYGINAFLWSAGTMRDLGISGSGVAINDSGQVAGFLNTGGTRHAFRWDDDTGLLDLGTLGGTRSEGKAINASGQVTGYAYLADESVHAFLWDGAAMRDLGTLGSTYSEGVAINAKGQVAGNSYTASWAYHAFLWDGTTLRDLGALGTLYAPSSESYASALNDAGQVTGWGQAYIRYVGWRNYAFVWDGGVLRDLDTVIYSKDPFLGHVRFSKATDINNHGQILASGVDDRTGEFHAYVLSPVTVPEMISDLETAVTGVGPGTSFMDKMTLIQTYYAANDIAATCAMLIDFVSQVRAQSGKKITTELAVRLTTDAQAVMTAIGCG